MKTDNIDTYNRFTGLLSLAQACMRVYMLCQSEVTGSMERLTPTDCFCIVMTTLIVWANSLGALRYQFQIRSINNMGKYLTLFVYL